MLHTKHVVWSSVFSIYKRSANGRCTVAVSNTVPRLSRTTILLNLSRSTGHVFIFLDHFMRHSKQNVWLQHEGEPVFWSLNLIRQIEHLSRSSSELSSEELSPDVTFPSPCDDVLGPRGSNSVSESLNAGTTPRLRRPTEQSLSLDSSSYITWKRTKRSKPRIQRLVTRLTPYSLSASIFVFAIVPTSRRFLIPRRKSLFWGCASWSAGRRRCLRSSSLTTVTKYVICWSDGL